MGRECPVVTSVDPGSQDRKGHDPFIPSPSEYSPNMGADMPTRRIFEVALVIAVFTHPAMGLVKMWAQKRLATGKNSGIIHGAAEIAIILA